jgi:hypothetical protein
MYLTLSFGSECKRHAIMSGEVFPYLVPQSPDCVQWGPWEMLDDEAWVLMPDEFEGWDSGTDVVLRRTVQVDLVTFTRETLLQREDVRVTASWTSSTTDMTDACAPAPLGPDGHGLLQFRMNGSRIAGVLTLVATVTLHRTPLAEQIGVARIPGSMIVREQRRVVLEGNTSMFPVHEVDFSATPLPTDASWHLETTPDLDAPFLGTFQLLLNSRDRELCAAVRNPKDKRQQALCDALYGDLAMLMLEIAVRERDELMERTWLADTVGQVLLGLLVNSGLEHDVFPDSGGTSRFRSRLDEAVRNMGQGRPFT